jgi:hypothetical protein
MFAFQTFILPYIEHAEVDDIVNYLLREYPDSALAGSHEISTYICPSDPQGFESTYALDPPLMKTNMSSVADSLDHLCSKKMYRLGEDDAAGRYRGANGTLFNNSKTRIRSIRDGTSQTLMVGEVTGGEAGSNRGYFWLTHNSNDTFDGINGPETLPGGAQSFHFHGGGFSSYHPEGCHFTFADASVHFIRQDVDQATLAALTTREGADDVGADY